MAARFWPKGDAECSEISIVGINAFGDNGRLAHRTVRPNNALHPSLDPARLALPLQAACVKCV